LNRRDEAPHVLPAATIAALRRAMIAYLDEMTPGHRWFSAHEHPDPGSATMRISAIDLFKGHAPGAIISREAGDAPPPEGPT
jgi:hypothetical protein